MFFLFVTSNQLQSPEATDYRTYVVYFLRLFVPIALSWMYFKFRRSTSKALSQNIHKKENVESCQASLPENAIRYRGSQKDALTALTSSAVKSAGSPTKGARCMTPDEAALIAQMQAAASFYSPQSPVNSCNEFAPSASFPPALASIKGYSLATLLGARREPVEKPQELAGITFLPVAEVNSLLKDQRKNLKAQAKKKKNVEAKERRNNTANTCVDLVAKMVEQCALDERLYLEMVLHLSVDKPDVRRPPLDYQNILLGTLKFRQPASSKVVRSILDRIDRHEKARLCDKPVMDACFYELAVRCALADTTTKCPEGNLELAADLLKRMEAQMGPGSEPMPYTMNLLLERYKQYSQSLPNWSNNSRPRSDVDSNSGLPTATPQIQRAAARREEEEEGFDWNKVKKLTSPAPRSSLVLMASDLEKSLTTHSEATSSNRWNPDAPIFTPSDQPLLPPAHWGFAAHYQGPRRRK